MNRLNIAALIAATGLLAGCAGPLGEFRPLYATAAGPGLSRIETRSPDGRIGYLLREELDDALGPDRSQPPLYRLVLTVKEARVPRGLRIDNVANRYELNVSAEYILIDLSTRKALDRGLVTTTVTYDSADQAYAAVSAHQDGQRRAAADLATRLRTSVATFFANPAPKAEIEARRAALQTQGIETLGDRLAPQSIESPSARALQTDTERQQDVDGN